MIKIANKDGSETRYQSIECAVENGVSQSVIDEQILQQKWQDIKKERQLLLYKTDWTQGKDTPLAAEKVTAFATYRQALRDIPQNVGNPDDVVWPTPPIL